MFIQDTAIIIKASSAEISISIIVFLHEFNLKLLKVKTCNRVTKTYTIQI